MKAAAYRQLARVEHRHWWYLGMRAIARQLLHAQGVLGAVLDVGCGTGGWLGTLGGARAAVGADLHPLALRLAARGLPGAVTRAHAQQLPFADRVFDTVTCLDVLYHQAIGSDVAVLHEIARVLRPGGRVLIQVPAYDWLRSEHDRDVATRQRYTGRLVAQRLQAARLTIDRLTYANGLLLPAAVVWRLADRWRGGGPAADLDIPPAPINWLLRYALKAEGLWLRRHDLPAGLSVIALAHRPQTDWSVS